MGSGRRSTSNEVRVILEPTHTGSNSLAAPKVK